MGFRTIIIKNRSKLDLKMNYLVCRSNEETKVFIPEISTLILESTAISLTTALISELTKNNVKIIFCDEKHNPESETVKIYGNYNTYKKIKLQINWSDAIKATLWQNIIIQKIKNQMIFLKELGLIKESQMLNVYLNEVALNDITNREGHSAKVYFNALFGLDFSRKNSHIINSALNYGYAVILSCFAREIVANGYLTQLGIWHKNEFNYFNLASDFMEPFRILVDRTVYSINDFTSENYKIKVLDILNLTLKIGGKKQTLENAITIYCQSLFDALNNNDINLVKHYEL